MVRLAPFRGQVVVDRPDEPLLTWVRQLTGRSQNQARKLVELGKVYVDGEPTARPFDRISVGAEVSIDTNRKRHALRPKFSSDRVIHRDADLLVVEKPPGIASVPPTRTGEPTLKEHLDRWLENSQAVPVHRLDAETSGLMAFGVQGGSVDALRVLFRKHRVDRRYLAIVCGVPDHGTLEDNIDVTRRGFSGRRQIRHAVTRVEILERHGKYTLVECRPETGRWHQLRIQLTLHGAPIVGEKQHLPNELQGGATPWKRRQRLALHSHYLRLTHPRSGETLEWSSPLPDPLKRLLVGGSQ